MVSMGISAPVLYIPPYSPFLHPVELFSERLLKVHDRQPNDLVSLLQAMMCDDIHADASQEGIHHARPFSPRCLARENIVADVDEVSCPDQNMRQDAE